MGIQISCNAGRGRVRRRLTLAWDYHGQLICCFPCCQAQTFDDLKPSQVIYNSCPQHSFDHQGCSGHPDGIQHPTSDRDNCSVTACRCGVPGSPESGQCCALRPAGRCRVCSQPFPSGSLGQMAGDQCPMIGSTALDFKGCQISSYNEAARVPGSPGSGRCCARHRAGLCAAGSAASGPPHLPPPGG